MHEIMKEEIQIGI